MFCLFKLAREYLIDLLNLTGRGFREPGISCAPQKIKVSVRHRVNAHDSFIFPRYLIKCVFVYVLYADKLEQPLIVRSFYLAEYLVKLFFIKISLFFIFFNSFCIFFGVFIPHYFRILPVTDYLFVVEPDLFNMYLMELFFIVDIPAGVIIEKYPAFVPFSVVHCSGQFVLF